MRNTITFLDADGHWDFFQPEQARQMGYEAEADEAERLQAECLVTQHAYTPDEAWKRVIARRERFKDGAWIEERKRLREILQSRQIYKMSEEERQQLTEQGIALGREAKQKELDSWAPPKCKNCGATDSYQTIDDKVESTRTMQRYTGSGLGIEATWKVTWKCRSCGHTMERAIKRVI